MVTSLDCLAACPEVLGKTGDPFGSSLVAPLLGMDSKVGLEWFRCCKVLVDDFG
jgi:hypothetical protein